MINNHVIEAIKSISKEVSVEIITNTEDMSWENQVAWAIDAHIHQITTIIST